MTEIDRRYFDGLLAVRGLSLRELARRMGMSHSQMSLTFSGARRMQLDEAAQIATILGVPMHAVIEHMGVRVGAQRVDVAGIMRGDGLVVPPPAAIERTAAPDALPDTAVAIHCRTADTSLSWMDGWTMFCAAPPAPGTIGPAVLDLFCYAGLADGRATCATLRRGYAQGTFNLAGPFAAQDVELAWATPILLTRH